MRTQAADLVVLYLALNAELDAVKQQQYYLKRREAALRKIIEGYKEIAELARTLDGPNWKAERK